MDRLEIPQEILGLQADLSDEELQVLNRIFKEMSEDGSSSTLSQIWSEDYEEIPVDIETFIKDRRYLGETYMTEDDHCLIYPRWIQTLKDIFQPDSRVMELALSGAIGIGKTETAVLVMSYILYRLLCLKNPASYYKLSRKSRIALAFINIDLNQAYGVGYAKLQGLLLNSPWFLEHGTVSGRIHKTYYPSKNIDILVGSKLEHFIGRDVFGAMIDELNFLPGSDPHMELSKAMKIYNTIRRRMESRFMSQGFMPGKLVLASSKKSESDFLEQYIKRNKDKPFLYLVDEPIWVIKAGLGLYSGKTFPVAIGDRFRRSKIIEESEVSSYEANGQEVIQVPIEYYEAFDLDINSAVMDIAGKALSSNLKFIYYEKLKLAYRDYLRNPFTMEEIQLGFDDTSEIKDFLLPEFLSKLDRSKPHFIHWDTSKSGDATGLAMTTIAGHREVQKLVHGQIYSANDIIHKLTFGIKIKSLPGSEIPFYKIRNFIYYLKFELGFNIISVTCDSYQSVDTLQQLSLKGFLTNTLSVDRTRIPYESYKNAINEGRLLMPYIKVLETESLELEDDKISGKIDHPVAGSKDLSDAVAASIHQSLNYRELMKRYNAQQDTETFVAVNNPSANASNWIMKPGVRVYD